MEESRPFLFPAHMPREVAQTLLAEAYNGLDAGKLLRQALKRQRKEGWDPPADIEYVGQPALADYPEGVGVSLATDILVHEVFEGIDECTDIFEGVLGEALMERLEGLVAKWAKRNPPPAP